jgi:hypothetical protein
VTWPAGNSFSRGGCRATDEVTIAWGGCSLVTGAAGVRAGGLVDGALPDGDGSSATSVSSDCGDPEESEADADGRTSGGAGAVTVFGMFEEYSTRDVSDAVAVS